MILHDDPLGTTAHGVPFVFVAPLPPLRCVISLWLTPTLQNFALVLVRRSLVDMERTHLNDVTQHYTSGPGTVHTSMVSYPSAFVDS